MKYALKNEVAFATMKNSDMHGRKGLSTMFVLMSECYPVATFMSTGEGFCIDRIINPKRLPVSVTDDRTLSLWMTARGIPASRVHLTKLLQQTGLDLQTMRERANGLSLIDTFWVRRQEESLEWNQINYFDNNFSDDIGEFLSGKFDSKNLQRSPTLETAGVLTKKWKIDKGRRVLIKITHSWRNSLSEVIAYIIGKYIGVNSVEYTLAENGRGCVCPCFIKKGNNLITASQYLMCKGIAVEDTWKNNKSFLEILSEPCGREWLEQMILVDFIMMNTDRHTDNFGFIEDAETRKIIGYAPLFDAERSLVFMDEIDRQNRLLGGARPFCDNLEDQLRLVSMSKWGDKLRLLMKVCEPAMRRAMTGLINEPDVLLKALQERINLAIQQ